MIAYADASVVLRVLLAERSALPEWPLVDQVVASRLLRTECLRSFHRIRLANFLDDESLIKALAGADELFSKIHFADLDTAVVERAGEAFATSLGTLHAIHLSTALLWQSDHGRALDAFLTHDVELGRAARGAGLRVLGC